MDGAGFPFRRINPWLGMGAGPRRNRVQRALRYAGAGANQEAVQGQ